MDMLALAVEDFNIFIKNTLVEEYYVTRGSDSLSVECLSTTSMHSISNEGFIDWVKDKLSKLGRRFVVLVNKVVARFSKNREKLEQNIELYKKDPNATVILAVSPKTLKIISLVTAAVTAGIIAMVLCIPRKDGSTRIAQIYKGLKDRIAKAKNLVKRDKAAKGHPVKASEAAAASEEAVKESKKAEDTVKQAGSKVSDTNPGGDPNTAKGSVNNAANATSKIADVVNDVAGLQDTAAQRPADTGSVSSDPEVKSRMKALEDEIAPRLHHVKGKLASKITYDETTRKLYDDYAQKIDELRSSYKQEVAKAPDVETALRVIEKAHNEFGAVSSEFVRDVNRRTTELAKDGVSRAPKQLTDASKPTVADLKKFVDEKMKRVQELSDELCEEMKPKNDSEENSVEFRRLCRKYRVKVINTCTQAAVAADEVASERKTDSKERILNITADAFDRLREYNDEFADKADEFVDKADAL